MQEQNIRINARFTAQLARSFTKAGLHAGENLYRESGRHLSAHANKGLAVAKSNVAESQSNVAREEFCSRLRAMQSAERVFVRYPCPNLATAMSA